MGSGGTEGYPRVSKIYAKVEQKAKDTKKIMETGAECLFNRKDGKILVCALVG